MSKKSKIKIGATERGFGLGKFTDYYGIKCSIQKSSLADKDAIWLGVDDPEPKILACKVNGGIPDGWVDYPISKDVSLSTRMHLTREMVKELLPVLQKFVKTGDID